MVITKLTDKQTLLQFLERQPDIQFYCIGDLDDFFWPHTSWYGLTGENGIHSVALLYSGGEIPTFLLFYKGDPSDPLSLIEKIRIKLPRKFYAHLTPPLINAFKQDEIHENYGLHYKMVLEKIPPDTDDPSIRRLGVSDMSEILGLYSVSYPYNWFDKRMLETGKYFGYFIKGHLKGISGVHVYSAKYRIAALGNIAVHPDHRRKGIAFRLTVRLCNDLKGDVDTIGLNVKADNEFAIRSYMKAGFKITGKYDECFIVSAE